MLEQKTLFHVLYYQLARYYRTLPMRTMAIGIDIAGYRAFYVENKHLK